MVKQDVVRRDEFHLLKIKNAAAIGNVSPRTFARWDSLGLTPKAIRIKKTKRYLKTDIDLWIEWGCPNRAEFEARKGAER